MHFLVTGATGFLGSHLTRLLTERGHRVTVLRRQSSDLRALEGLQVSYATADVTEPGSLARIFSSARVGGLFHVAGDTSMLRRDAERQRRVNVEGTRNILRAAREQGVRRAVVTSSVGAIGRSIGGVPATEELGYNWPRGLRYMESKRDGELACWAACAEGIEVVVVNPSVVLGPGEWTQKARPLVKLVSSGAPWVYPPGGTNVVDVRDVALGHLLAWQKGRSGQRYILGGENLENRKLIELFCEAAGRPPPRIPVPGLALRAGAILGQALEKLLPLPMPALYLALVPETTFFSIEKARTALGYTHRPARETVIDTVKWYREAGLV
ncbi:MAG TPA: NAD-dependent epimerase/dehydratase family protein [Polyangia bacterium]|nr:NAD-dependent epimerase/dehydratase family protein [Polyangia bacterium]